MVGIWSKKNIYIPSKTGLPSDGARVAKQIVALGGHAGIIYE